MYAIIQTGGKQYRVTPGAVVVVERLPGEEGDTVNFSEVLMCGDAEKSHVGSPFVPQAAVVATIREHSRGDKIIVFKKKRRQNYRRKKGHMQDITVLEVAEIRVEGKSYAGVAKPAKKPVKKAAEEAPVEKAAKAEAKTEKAESKPAAKAAPKATAKPAPKAEAKPVKAKSEKAAAAKAPKKTVKTPAKTKEK